MNKIKTLLPGIAGEIFPTGKIGMRVLLFTLLLLAGGFSSFAQNVNVDNAKINIGSGVYLTAGGEVKMQNSGAIDNSGTIKLNGDWTNNASGLINASPGKVEFTGTASQAIGGSAVTSFNDVNLDNTAGASLGNNQTINGALTFTNGKITTGANALELGAAATTSGAASGKYVYGNLKIDVIASGAKSFVIGDATTYAPIDLNINGVSASGSITATTLSGAEPNENNPITNSSGINQAAKANRYWTMSNSGVTFTNYSAAFNYDAAEATGNPLNYVVRKFGPIWGTTTLGTVTATSTQATGLTAFSEFEVGVPNAAPVIGACPGNIISCTNPVTWTNPTVTGSPAALVTCVPASGSTFSLGTTPVTCTATNINGSSSCGFTVTINTPSTAPTSATSNALYGQICSPGNVTLTQVGGTLGTGASWVWYDGGCGVGASIGSGSPLIVTSPALGLHNYFVRAESGCPPTACQSVSVNVINAPPVNTVHYTASINDGCVSAPAAAFTVNAVAGCTFYNWTSAQAGVRFNGNPSPFQTTVPTVNVTFVSLPAAGASGWSICVFGGNVCGNTNTICTWVRATVSAPTSIIGSVIGCPGTSLNPYSSSAVGGAATYQWSSTGGIVVTGNGAQAVTLAFPGGFVSGTLSVHGQTSCGYNGPNKTITITAVPATPGTITGPSYPCPSLSSNYSILPIPGALNYTWTTSVPGAIVTGTSNTCSILFPAVIPGGSIVSVIANSSCPTSSIMRSKGIATGLPGIPGPISGLTTGQCGATGVSYTINPVPNAVNYNWSSTCGTIVGPTNLSGISIDWPPFFSTCTLNVSVTTGCGTGSARTLAVAGVPSLPPAISGNTLPCQNALEIYSTLGSVGATSYTWGFPAGASILGPISGPSIFLQWGNTSGSVTVKANNDCGFSAIRSLPCTINCRQSQVGASATPFNAEIFPNPAVDKTTLKFNLDQAGRYHINLTNVIGQNVIATEGAATEGLNIVDLDLSTVAKGVYMISITSGDNAEQIRMVVE